MDNSGIYVGLDIGSTSIKVIVAERVKGQINVLGVGNVPSMGVQHGIIVDINKASKSIKRAISQAEEKASVQIHQVIVGIPSDLLKIRPCNGMIEISNQSREINDQDVRNVTSSAMMKNLPPEREVIDAIPDEFIVDGFDGIQDPRGMVGVKLEMHGHIVTGPKTIIHNTRKAVNQAGLKVFAFEINLLAQGQVLLDDGEQEFGTILIDIGGGQTTAAVIHNHQLKYVTVDHEGGQYITKDISEVLNTSLNNAEKLKRDYGYADSLDISKNNQFPVKVVGQSKPINVSEKLLSEIIQARLEQIFGRIKENLDRFSTLNLPGGIILTGGVAALPGISGLVADYFDSNVRIYVPNQMGLRHPSFALPLSLVAYQAQLSQIESLVRSTAFIKMNPSSLDKPSSLNSVTKSDQSVHPVHHNLVKDSKHAIKTKKHHHRINREGIKRFFSDFFD